MQKEKRITLNAEKRKTIANVFQSLWEREDSPVRADMKILVEQIVRKYQPLNERKICQKKNA